jgi:hypothetical protein
MTKNTKTLLGVVALVGVGYYAYKKNWFKNPFKSFTANENYLNLTAPQGCTFYSGNAGYVGQVITSWGANGGVIVSTGGGQTLVCPRGQRYTNPQS